MTETETRRGDWLQTYTGRRFWPLDPRAEDLHIVDIAHALSNLCRYGGHARQFYSVAQHSVLVSEQVAPAIALEGLLHDAPEAYLLDLPTPIKTQIGPSYSAAEEAIMEKIAGCFQLRWPLPAAIKTADRAVLGAEIRQFMGAADWTRAPEPAPVGRIRPQLPNEARDGFLARFGELVRGA